MVRLEFGILSARNPGPIGDRKSPGLLELEGVESSVFPTPTQLQAFKFTPIREKPLPLPSTAPNLLKLCLHKDQLQQDY